MHFKWSFSIAMFVYQRVIREADMFGHLRMIKKKHPSSDVAAGSQHKLSRMNPNRFYPHPSISHLYSHYSLSDKHRPHSPPYGGSKPFFYLVGGFNPSEKYEFVSGDYYSQYMESHKNHVPNHQLLSDWHTLVLPHGLPLIFSMGFFNHKMVFLGWPISSTPMVHQDFDVTISVFSPFLDSLW